MTEKNVYVLEPNRSYPALGECLVAVCLDDDELITEAPSMWDLVYMFSAYLCVLHEKDKRLTITVEVGE